MPPAAVGVACCRLLGWLHMSTEKIWVAISLGEEEK